jgi:hypothetical protein
MKNSLKVYKKEEGTYSPHFLPSLFMSREEQELDACRYRIRRILSDTPPQTDLDTYPYKEHPEGVKLHPIFQALFPDGKIPLMSKEEADKLCDTQIGYDRHSGAPCRLVKEDGRITVEVYPAINAAPYIMDCFAGEKRSSS